MRARAAWAALIGIFVCGVPNDVPIASLFAVYPAEAGRSSDTVAGSIRDVPKDEKLGVASPKRFVALRIDGIAESYNSCGFPESYCHRFGGNDGRGIFEVRGECSIGRLNIGLHGIFGDCGLGFARVDDREVDLGRKAIAPMKGQICRLDNNFSPVCGGKFRTGEINRGLHVAGLTNARPDGEFELLFAGGVEQDSSTPKPNRGERQNASEGHEPERVKSERFVGFIFFWLGCFVGGSLFMLASYFAFGHVATVHAKEEARAKHKAH